MYLCVYVTDCLAMALVDLINDGFCIFCAGPDPPHGYSDSSEMVKAILQTVQNQDRVLKDLYTHLRYSLSRVKDSNIFIICRILKF